MTNDDDALIPRTKVQKPRGGPVYQGVCKSIRALEDEGLVDKKVDAGSIAQARSIAASIDRVDGHDGGPQSSGMQLAALHAQLSEVLVRLNPAGASDPFQDFLNELDKEDSPDGRAPAPHPEV